MVTVASEESFLKSIKEPGKTEKPLPKGEAKRPLLIVFRHGETFYNREKLFCGKFDSLLTPEGKRQAEVLRDKLVEIPIDNGIIAPLSRCRESLTIALGSRSEIPQRPEPLIYERDYGSLTGKSKEALYRESPQMALEYRRSWEIRPPGGESLQDVWQNRVEIFCQETEKATRQNNSATIICCTNNTMRLIRMYFEKLTIPQMLELENPLAQDYCLYHLP